MLNLLDFRIHVGFRECLFFSRQVFFVLRTLQTLTGNHPSYPLYPGGVSLEDMKGQILFISVIPLQVSYPFWLLTCNVYRFHWYRSDWWWPPDLKFQFLFRFSEELLKERKEQRDMRNSVLVMSPGRWPMRTWWNPIANHAPNMSVLKSGPKTVVDGLYRGWNIQPSYMRIISHYKDPY